MIRPEALMDVVADVDDAIRRRDAGSLRSFVDEAQASGLDATARRGRAALAELARAPRSTAEIRRTLDELRAPSEGGHRGPSPVREAAQREHARQLNERLANGRKVGEEERERRLIESLAAGEDTDRMTACGAPCSATTAPWPRAGGWRTASRRSSTTRSSTTARPCG